MAKGQFKVGASFDFLSPEEHKQHLKEQQNFFADLLTGQEDDTITRSAGPFTTDSTGGTSTLPKGGAGVFRVPAGYDAFMTRLSVDYEGSDAATPQTCDLRVVADQNTPAALRTIANQVPNVFSDGKSSAPLFRGGQEVVVCMTGGPASTKIYCTIQVLILKRKPLNLDILDGQ